jgi:hypothetical protein
MKREPGSKSKRIVWDEANLEENERIKKTLSTVKINEPKTPYCGSIAEDHELLSEELQPLELGMQDHELLQQAAGILGAGDVEPRHNGSSSDVEAASDHSHRPSSSAGSGFSSDGDLQVGSLGEPGGHWLAGRLAGWLAGWGGRAAAS